VKITDSNALRFDEAASFLAASLYEILLRIPEGIKSGASEIRVRAARPLAVTYQNKTVYIRADGKADTTPATGAIVSAKEVSDSVIILCGHSVHTHQDEMKQGFISVKGGHRAGICGETVIDTHGNVTAVRNISSINLRVARQIVGCAALLCDYFDGKPKSMLVSGGPGTGKTTILRDLARMLSLAGMRVAVADERFEIAASSAGVSQNDLGPSCDVISGSPKASAILTAVRVLSPDIIICDELGSNEEIEAVSDCVNRGVKLAASVHAGDISELMRRQNIRRLIENKSFDCVAQLSKGQVGEIGGLYTSEELLNDKVYGAYFAGHMYNTRGNDEIRKIAMCPCMHT
jgi:stage III sporulation protein AA